MNKELPEMDFQRFWRRLQQIGLNAYEARSYLVLDGHPRFKALGTRRPIPRPRQKIYEVLDSLIEKGFAQVVQEKTKLFSAVEPTSRSQLPGASRRSGAAWSRGSVALAGGLVEDLKRAYSKDSGRGTLDYLRIVSDLSQTASQYRRMLSEVQTEYLEFFAASVRGRSAR